MKKQFHVNVLTFADSKVTMDIKSQPWNAARLNAWALKTEAARTSLREADSTAVFKRVLNNELVSCASIPCNTNEEAQIIRYNMLKAFTELGTAQSKLKTVEKKYLEALEIINA